MVLTHKTAQLLRKFHFWKSAVSRNWALLALSYVLGDLTELNLVSLIKEWLELAIRVDYLRVFCALEPVFLDVSPALFRS